MSNVFLMLVGNKLDCTEQRCVNYRDAKRMADEHDATYIETSAKDNLGITELFVMIAKQMLMRYETAPVPAPDTNNVILHGESEEK